MRVEDIMNFCAVVVYEYVGFRDSYLIPDPPAHPINETWRRNSLAGVECKNAIMRHRK